MERACSFCDVLRTVLEVEEMVLALAAVESVVQAWAADAAVEAAASPTKAARSAVAESQP